MEHWRWYLIVSSWWRCQTSWTDRSQTKKGSLPELQGKKKEKEVKKEKALSMQLAKAPIEPEAIFKSQAARGFRR
jgi:hypothetical protein